MFLLFNVLAIFALGTLGGICGAILEGYGRILLAQLGIHVAASIIPSLALAVRRLHDSGKSGWLLLQFFVLGIIPVVGLISGVVQILVMCEDSDPGMNKYGPNPKFSEQGVETVAGNANSTSMGLASHAQAFTGENYSAVCGNCGAKLKDASGSCSGCAVNI